jgi:hypothetical protein
MSKNPVAATQRGFLTSGAAWLQGSALMRCCTLEFIFVFLVYEYLMAFFGAKIHRKIESHLVAIFNVCTSIYRYLHG